MHKTAAWPLALVYAGLIVYASLYPFTGWRDQGIAPWFFLTARPAHFWTWFDVWVNIAGYLPLGGLLALSALRTRRIRHAVLVPLLVGCLLSLAMECLQAFLPARVPSREDWLLNTAGTGLGAAGAMLLERWGIIDRWSRVRARWFVTHARGGIVLLALWPAALLFPPAVPFGLGQVLERLIDTLPDYLEGTPWLAWVPVRDMALQALVPGGEMLCVALGVLIPCLLGFCVIRVPWRRAAMALGLLAVGVATTALSAALSWGPVHAWAWLDLPAQVGMVVAVVLALALIFVPWRANAALLVLALGVYLSVLNQAPEGAYFAQTLQTWEQGRFIRFHGLAQWLGWLWPYATLAYVLSLIGQREPHH